MKEALAIVYAMPAEAALIKKRFGPLSEAFVEGGIKGWAGGEGDQLIALAQTGIGQHQAAKAVRLLADNFKVNALFSIGYAGAADPELEAGDLIIGSRVLALEGLEKRETYESDPSLFQMSVEIAESLGQRHGIGEIASVNRFIPEAARKREIFYETGARAIEMESAAIANAAASLRIPAAFLRAISDQASLDLSLWYERVIVAPTPQSEGFKAAMENPELKETAAMLERNSILASRNLALFVEELLNRFRAENSTCARLRKEIA